MTQSSSPAVAPAPAANSASLLDGTDATPLFTPFSLSGVELANRFVMAPMTRQSSPGGVPGDDVAAYYVRRAAHVGLIVTEGTYVDHLSAGTSDQVPRLYGDDALAGWRRVVDAVHRVGGRIVPQLWHLGAFRETGTPPHPRAPVLSPSGLRADGTVVGDAATTAEIDAVIASFARAAVAARQVGFDGVELHGAHGYLLDQFFWQRTNRRADGYGGSLARRARVGAEVVAAIRGEVGPDFPVTYRFSQWKAGHFDARVAETPGELDALFTPLVEAGLTALHVSTRRYWLPAFDDSPRTLAGWAKHLTGLPTIAIGSVGVPTAFRGDGEEAAPSLSLAPLMELFARGEFDLVGLGRVLLSEPAWTTKLRDRRLAEIRPYNKADETRLT
jgi:2,4-dienoyl-CoA reductase-like NADH-dependent reductase (Old Yellow Enzyme family)